jgi:hypothetical protein
MCFVGNYMTGSVINDKAKYSHDDVKITDKCTFSEGSNKILPIRT